MKTTVRIFISSPSDVEVERQVALQVIQRLGRQYANSLTLKPILWEREPLLASEHFQDALDPAIADIMVCIVWSTLGSPLPDRFQGVDGRTGLTGTEWEFEYGLKAHDETGQPLLLVYRKTASVMTDAKDSELTKKITRQQEEVEAFFQHHFHHDDQNNTFERAHRTFEKVHEFEQQLETHLTPLIEQHLQADTNADTNAGNTVIWHQGSPFLGLAAFEERHQAVFFGRVRAIGELMSQYRQQIAQQTPFLMVTGMSGSGKSSLLHAGILPRVKIPRVVSYDVGHVAIIHTRPQALLHAEGPLMGLCQVLVSQLPQISDAAILYEQIQHSPKSLQDTCRRVCQSLAQDNNLHDQVQARIQLVLDQSEELFTSRSVTQAQQAQFWTGLRAVIATGYVWCIGSMRSDFVGQGQGTELYELLRGGGDYKLQPPDNGEIQQIIEAPAQAAGLSFETNSSGVSLAAVIREDSQAQPGALPLVEFCLDELFQLAQENSEQRILTFAAYQDTLGGLAGAISGRADAVVAQLQQQGIEVDSLLPKLFNALIRVNPDNPGEAATSATIPLDHFADQPELARITDSFIAARLIIASHTHLRIAHEALIHGWQRISQWLAIDNEFQLFRARIERDMAIWRQEQEPKSRLLPPGKPLSEALAWQSQRQSDLSPEVMAHTQATSRCLLQSYHSACGTRRTCEGM